jgi:hypothetical protein
MMSFPDTKITNSPYWTKANSLFRTNDDGPEQLTNFVCVIKEELIHHDGPKTTTTLKIQGFLQPGQRDVPNLDATEDTRMPEISIPATDFAGMSWVCDKWGMRPIIFAGANAAKHIAIASQALSKPTTQHVYTHTGWSEFEGQPVYLHLDGGITAAGAETGLRVALPAELVHYRLPQPTGSKDAFTSSMKLPIIGPHHITVPLLLATYRAAVGPVDFAMHLAGRTGTFKSELVSLFQSHYGSAMTARKLPGSWSSTPNAMEHLAYRAKDALFALDDFVPTGTAYQVRGLQKTADQIIRAAGNQAGRARLTDISSLQTTYYPRGLILSTGEDIPEGQSVRGRMMILELAPGDIDTKALTVAQADRDQYSAAMADWIQWLAQTQPYERLRALAEHRRDEVLGIGHARTPSMIGELAATAEILAEYGLERKFFTKTVADGFRRRAVAAVLDAAGRQKDYLEQSDPVNAIVETIRRVLTSQIAHLKTKNGGVPENAEQYGYEVKKDAGTVPQYKASGARIGWMDAKADELYIDPNAITLLKRWAGGKLAVTDQILIKRMKEAGVLRRTDTTRQQNKVRVTVEGHYRLVLCLSLTDTMTDA